MRFKIDEKTCIIDLQTLKINLPILRTLLSIYR